QHRHSRYNLHVHAARRCKRLRIQRWGWRGCEIEDRQQSCQPMLSGSAVTAIEEAVAAPAMNHSQTLQIRDMREDQNDGSHDPAIVSDDHGVGSFWLWSHNCHERYDADNHSCWYADANARG